MRISLSLLFSAVSLIVLCVGCARPTEHAWHGPPWKVPDASSSLDFYPPDLSTVPSDLTPLADLAQGSVVPSDLSMFVADLALPPADLAVIAPAPSVTAIFPAQGPLGSMITVAGSGFAPGDTVEISGAQPSPATLPSISIASTAIVVALQGITAAVPTSATLRVRRGIATYPSGGLPFLITQGKAYYISTQGSDANSGSILQPWRTVGGASTHMAPGDFAYLRGGTYSGQIAITASGSAGLPLTFTGYPGESPLLIEPPTSPGADLDTIRVYGSYITLDHLRISDQNDPGQAIWIAGSSHDVMVSHSEIFGAHGQGILITGDKNTIYRNSIHDNGTHTPYDHGIYIEGGGNLVRSNTIYNNWTFGIQLYDGSNVSHAGNTIEYNYVYHNGFGSTAQDPNAPNAGIVIASAHSNSIIRYNTFCDNSQYGIYLIDDQDGTQMTGNITCYNRRGGHYMRYPGSGNSLTGAISFNDTGFALSSNAGVSSNSNTFYLTQGSLTWEWGGTSYQSLASFVSASGQDGSSKVADPKFTNVPTGGFDPKLAATYNFCTSLIPAFCQPLP